MDGTKPESYMGFKEADKIIIDCRTKYNHIG